MTYRLVVTSNQVKGQQIVLNSKQLHYLRRVLRFAQGSRFIALDGIGNCWLVELNHNSAHIIKSIDIKTELSISLSLITALPKSSGYEQVLRCCTELGVSKFLPVISDRTIPKPSQNKVLRWHKIVTEAAEQSERQVVPVVLEPKKFRSVIQDCIPETAKYICLARGDLPTLWNSLKLQTQSEIIIATGCEGGWTESEVEQAISASFQPVSLGKRILRAVTAPIAASSIVMAIGEKTTNY